ncbi:hypothetical protein IQ270_22325 [Microcoleus sp. LEGE 07076]|uniref:hypothetical protein n=1 Tax=Microcoleus sp. LEGE 07076 TaxID=915322 RepID=UPI00187FF977|nr:hypothetical protein [Microcoleus sp. LEGE 07076]MBE9187314.1 hypothetical protein [Microcoleus sp. LEGE 07076]
MQPADLWDLLSAVYNMPCIIQIFWAAYQKLFPRKRHQSVGRDRGKTFDSERFNNTLSKKSVAIVIKTLSFYKKLSNHLGAIWYFIHHKFFCLRLKLFMIFPGYAGLAKGLSWVTQLCFSSSALS